MLISGFAIAQKVEEEVPFFESDWTSQIILTSFVSEILPAFLSDPPFANTVGRNAACAILDLCHNYFVGPGEHRSIVVGDGASSIVPGSSRVTR